MSEFVDLGSGYGSQTTELYLKRNLSGDVESVRVRLAAALERVGYDLIEDEPVLRGRRGSRGWGTWYGSTDVLDYATTLVVRLKPINSFTTRATFDYMIGHPYLLEGDKEVLIREAEAIVALAKVRQADKICAACGTDASDDSKFCRRCGSTMTSEQAELEVLHMTAEARAGHTSVVISTLLSLATLAISVIVFISIVLGREFKPEFLRVLFLLIGALLACNLVFGRFAWARLNKALKPKGDQRSPAPFQEPNYIPATVEAVALPPALESFISVTDSTTELLDPFEAQKEPVPISTRRTLGE